MIGVIAALLLATVRMRGTALVGDTTDGERQMRVQDAADGGRFDLGSQISISASARRLAIGLLALAGAAAPLLQAEPVGAQPADPAAMLQAHNTYRARHGTPPLTWSTQLAASAQAWANACTPDPRNRDGFAHAPDAFRTFGENLYWGTGTSPQAGVDLWYNEVSRYDFNNPIVSFNAGNTDSRREVRHFTQLVWKDSRQLGCAVANCGARQLWVCRYSPPGNFNAQNPGVLANNVPRPVQVATTPPPTRPPTQPPTQPTTTPPPKPPTQPPTQPTTTPPPRPPTQPPTQPSTTPQPKPPAPPPTQPPAPTQGVNDWSAFATDGKGRWGYAAHQPAQQTAQTAAITACGGANAGCKVFWTTRDRCVAYAESRSGGYWSAAGGGTSLAQAQQNAVRFCQSGTAPRNTCRSVFSRCK